MSVADLKPRAWLHPTSNDRVSTSPLAYENGRALVLLDEALSWLDANLAGVPPAGGPETASHRQPNKEST